MGKDKHGKLEKKMRRKQLNYQFYSNFLGEWKEKRLFTCNTMKCPNKRSCRAQKCGNNINGIRIRKNIRCCIK